MHSKFEKVLRSVSGADVTALNIISNMKQFNNMKRFNIVVVVDDSLLRLIKRCPMRRRVRVRVRVGVRVALMMDVGCATSV